MNETRVLVAGIGNIFLGDDAFGVEAVRLLAGRAFPPGVTVRDFGIRGLDLCYALESCRAAILVDAAPRGRAPGTLTVLEPEVAPHSPQLPEPHRMTPDAVLARLAPGARPARIRIVTCEPESLEPDPDGLSPAVRAAAEAAGPLICRLVEDLLAEVGDRA